MSPHAGAPAKLLLEVEELTVLTAWAEAAAEALAYAPERAAAVLADARSGAGWRPTLGLAEPSEKLREAIDCMGRAVHAAPPPVDRPTLKAMVSAFQEDRPGETELECLVRRVLIAMLEQRGTRQPQQGEYH